MAITSESNVTGTTEARAAEGQSNVSADDKSLHDGATDSENSFDVRTVTTGRTVVNEMSSEESDCASLRATHQGRDDEQVVKESYMTKTQKRHKTRELRAEKMRQQEADVIEANRKAVEEYAKSLIAKTSSQVGKELTQSGKNKRKNKSVESAAQRVQKQEKVSDSREVCMMTSNCPLTIDCWTLCTERLMHGTSKE